MCSSKSSSDHGQIRTETKSSWLSLCMVDCLHGESGVAKPHVLGKVLSIVAAV